MPKESDIVRSMLRRLNAEEQVYCFRTHGSAFQMKGTPDIIGCAYGRFFAIEAKRSAKERPSKAQQYVLRKLEEAGGATFISYDPQVREAIEWIRSLQS